jgi:zinc D-Ala-D-Ala carboxypeptidase
MIQISAHISINEATHTGTGLPSVPDAETINRMVLVANKVFEPVRVHFNKPFRINSFFRSPKVNKAVGGVTSSQHVKGEAIDIHCEYIPDKVVFDYIKANLVFDQVLLEPSWVHISYSSVKNRQQALYARKVNGKMVYTTS